MGGHYALKLRISLWKRVRGRVSWCFWRMCSIHFLLFFQVFLWRSSIPSFVEGLSLGKFFFFHLLVYVLTDFSGSLLDPPSHIPRVGCFLGLRGCFCFFVRRNPPPTEDYTHTDPDTSTKTTDFLIREPSCRTSISKYLKSSNIRTEDKRHLIQIITNRFPVNTFTSKFKKNTSNRSDIWRCILKERGETMTEVILPVQTVVHITGYCLGQRDRITTVHHTTWKTIKVV